MPTWKGIILEEEFAPLVAYIKDLSKGSIATVSHGGAH